MRQTQPPPLENPEDREALLEVARASILHGLEHGSPLRVDPDRFSPRLREPGACFVTLRRSGSLRGCVGSLEATRSLVEDVAENAYASAFRDSRFEPLAEGELRDLDIHLSILTPPEPLPCTSEAELLAKLRPGIDGLVLEDGAHRATFLPSVWESLAEPKEFLAALKRKAGLSADHWSDRIRFHRYRAEAIE
jgi:AmmeMemoRadiSam system protein A